MYCKFTTLEKLTTLKAYNKEKRKQAEYEQESHTELTLEDLDERLDELNRFLRIKKKCPICYSLVLSTWTRCGTHLHPLLKGILHILLPALRTLHPP